MAVTFLANSLSTTARVEIYSLTVNSVLGECALLKKNDTRHELNLQHDRKWLNKYECIFICRINTQQG